MNLDKLNTMCAWERKKAIYLMNIAENKLNMNLNGYGEIGVNNNTGYTYLWCEDYNFTLYMAINCNLIESDVYVLYTDFTDGEETEESLANFDNLEQIYDWCEEIEKKHLFDE